MSDHVKYPRTLHLPWSPGATSDDKVHADVEALFGGREVVMSAKLDGENTTVYDDGYTHARSLDSRAHPSRDWMRRFAGGLVGQIPEGWRVPGENMFARHSIGYDRLPSYFIAFGFYDERNMCLGWDETVAWAKLIGLHLPPVLYRGPWDAGLIERSWTGRSAFGDEGEGYVVRLADAFAFDDFALSVGKFVREGHVTTDKHWMHDAVVQNGLASEPSVRG